MITKYIFDNISDCNLAHIFECGQCFRWNPDGDAYIGACGSYAARITLGENLVIEATGGDEKFWRHYLDLDTNYGDIKKSILKTCDAAMNKDCNIKLQAAINEGYGIRILNQDKFETIISFIISQNNNIPRIKKLVESLCERYGHPIEDSEKIAGHTLYAFPRPIDLLAIDPSELAEMKFGYRANYIPAAAKKFLDEGEPMTYEDLIAYLGIGPKVANCIQLFGLHKVDAFPIDTWVKHIMNDMYGFSESDTRGMAKFAEERFGKYAGYAQQYLFFYYRG